MTDPAAEYASGNDTDGRKEIALDTDGSRSLLDQLLRDSRLYTSSQDYKNLLAFITRLRNFAPFNALLLQVQKPGLSHAASAKDWADRFGRYPKEGARPLLILWPFGPVALVYDVQDTVGEPLPEGASLFAAHGDVNKAMMAECASQLTKKAIQVEWVDVGDNSAGWIRVLNPAFDDKDFTTYGIKINRNHAAPVQFSTLVHELGHLTLGHLGRDKKLGIPERIHLSHVQQEVEAESVAYIVCERNGVTVKSQAYLSYYVSQNMQIDDVDVYQVTRAAGQVETMLNLAAHTRFGDKPKRPKARTTCSSQLSLPLGNTLPSGNTHEDLLWD